MGKLGVIVQVKLRIVPEAVVRRELRTLTPTQWQGLLQQAQDQWNTQGSLPSWVDEAQAFWITQKRQVRGAWMQT